MVQLHNKHCDRIGIRYERLRQPDPRIFRAIRATLGSSGTILNVRAGADSDEPRDRFVVVEPQITMIRQRSRVAVPASQARAERLPFVDDAFDAAVAFCLRMQDRVARSGMHDTEASTVVRCFFQAQNLASQ